MTTRQGDMFKSGADVIVVTTNAIVNARGRLVMGRGAAYQATQKFPGCDIVFGSQVHRHFQDHKWMPYGVLIHPTQQSPELAIFQVKRHGQHKAEAELILYSVACLAAIAKSGWRNKRIALNYPGIGNGGLNESEVEPLLQILPSNVEVWKL